MQQKGTWDEECHRCSADDAVSLSGSVEERAIRLFSKHKYRIDEHSLQPRFVIRLNGLHEPTTDTQRSAAIAVRASAEAGKARESRMRRASLEAATLIAENSALSKRFTTTTSSTSQSVRYFSKSFQK